MMKTFHTVTTHKNITSNTLLKLQQYCNTQSPNDHQFTNQLSTV